MHKVSQKLGIWKPFQYHHSFYTHTSKPTKAVFPVKHDLSFSKSLPEQK